MRTPRPALEVRGNPGSLERVLEKAGVVLWRAQRDCHSIEGHAAAGLAQDAAGDFDGFAPFARRGIQLHGIERFAGRGNRGGKQITADARQARGATCGVRLRRDLLALETAAARNLECGGGPCITFGNRRERRRRPRKERVDELLFGPIRHRDVEQHEPAVRVPALRIGSGARGHA